jgi:hypothetical protein
MINEHVAVEHVLQSGLKIGDEIRVEQNFLILLLYDVTKAFQDDAIQREHAGLVRANQLENIAVRKVLSGHPLDYCDHLADIVASRLLLPCWRKA